MKYTVKQGDTLVKISKRFYGVSNRYIEIARINNIANPNTINVGQVIEILSDDEDISLHTDDEIIQTTPRVSISAIKQYLETLSSGIKEHKAGSRECGVTI